MADQLRLDILLTEKGLAPSRSKAQEMIKSGIVFVDGTPALKPSAVFAGDVSIDLQGEFCPFVSRGGLKLQKALREFSVDPKGLVCSDCGASTGGFTDCLLQLGAKKVFAIDVGTDQLVPSIRNDARVVAMEQTNIRYVTTDMLGEKLDLSVVDVSFISLRLVLPAIRDLLKEDGQIVCLIKPQFEAGKASVGKKGVVKDKATHILVLDQFLHFVRELGFCVRGLTFSPVTGPEGNIEFLAHLSLADLGDIDPDTCVIVHNAHQKLRG